MNEPRPGTDAAEDRERRRVPRWIWMAGIAAVIVALVVVTIMLLDGGHDGGPWRHGDGDDDPAPSNPTAGHTPPRGAHQ